MKDNIRHKAAKPRVCFWAFVVDGHGGGVKVIVYGIWFGVHGTKIGRRVRCR